MSKAWPMVKLGEVLTLQRRWVQLEPLTEYSEIGVRSYGRGIFHKTPVSGASLGNKRVLRICPGDLVFMNVFAWEGAVAVAGPAEEGMIGSHRFATYAPSVNRCDARFLQLFFRTQEGRELLGRVSPGSAGRNRTMNLAMFAEQEIPLPPLAEQRRIVARIEALAAQIAEARSLREQIANEAEVFVTSLHCTLAGTRQRTLGDILRLDEDATPVVPTGSYPQVGVRSFGGGLFAKGAVAGTETTYNKYNRLYAGALLLSQVKGWEGAIAACPEHLDGWFVSPEYRTFRCIPSEARSAYLAPLVRTEWFWGRLKDATRGVGARRERTRPEQFLQIRIPMPTVEQQAYGERAFTAIDALKQLQAQTAAELDALLPSILDRAFKGEL